MMKQELEFPKKAQIVNDEAGTEIFKENSNNQ